MRAARGKCWISSREEQLMTADLSSETMEPREVAPYPSPAAGQLSPAESLSGQDMFKNQGEINNFSDTGN